MAEQEVNVSIADEHRHRFGEIVEHCEKLGMKVRHKLASIGVLSGTIDSAKLGALRKVEGVAHAEAGRSFQIAPPKDEVQ
jgi:hypothetical protein